MEMSRVSSEFLREGRMVVCEAVWAEVAIAFAHAQARVRGHFVRSILRTLRGSKRRPYPPQSVGTGSADCPREETVSSLTSSRVAVPSPGRIDS